MTQPPHNENISALIEVMARLRDPEHGCPWDIEQTHKSIAPYTIEEAYEVAEAIENNDPIELKNELGDLLLQVVFQARIAEEDNHFNFAEVSQTITDKMIRRHPHIFGTDTHRTIDEQQRAWEAIKAEERAEKKQGGALDGVAMTLPALLRGIKLQNRAARVGFDWPHPKDVLDKINEEILEVSDELEQDPICPQRLEEEIGDLLFAVINLARKSATCPEQALKTANAKFTERFESMENQAAAQGRNLKDMTLDEMESLWQVAKNK